MRWGLERHPLRASFGNGNGFGKWERDLGAGRASKDIAESPTAIAGTPKINYNA